MKKIERPARSNGTTRPIRVVLADDHVMVREGLAQLLEEQESIIVIGQAGDGDQALALVKEKRPDVVVLDYTMPGMDGANVARKIRTLLPEVKVLLLTVHENVHYAIKSMESGAHGFILKAAAVEELVKGIHAVSKGKTFISPAMSEKMLESWSKSKQQTSGLSSLSQREFELLRFLGSGLQLQECARKMNISRSTVSTYRSRLMEKLSLRSTAEIIRFALENEITG